MDFSTANLAKLIKSEAFLPSKLKNKFLTIVPKLTEVQLKRIFEMFLAFHKDIQKLQDENEKSSQEFLQKKMKAITIVLKKENRKITKYSEMSSKKQDATEEEKLIREIKNI